MCRERDAEHSGYPRSHIVGQPDQPRSLIQSDTRSGGDERATHVSIGEADPAGRQRATALPAHKAALSYCRRQKCVSPRRRCRPRVRCEAIVQHGGDLQHDSSTNPTRPRPREFGRAPLESRPRTFACAVQDPQRDGDARGVLDRKGGTSDRGRCITRRSEVSRQVRQACDARDQENPCR